MDPASAGYPTGPTLSWADTKKGPLKSKHIKSKIAKNKKQRYKYSVGKSYELNNLK